MAHTMLLEELDQITRLQLVASVLMKLNDKKLSGNERPKRLSDKERLRDAERLKKPDADKKQLKLSG